MTSQQSKHRLKPKSKLQSKHLVKALACATLSFSSWLSVSSVYAYERQHDTHLHGEGHINLVLSGSQLEAEMRFPMKDIVGFERQPSSEAEHAAIEQAKAQLAQAPSLLMLSAAAECKLTDSHIVIAAEESHADHEDDHHKGDHHDEEHHNKEHHDDDHHEHAHKNHAHGHEAHHDEEHHEEHHEHKDAHHDHAKEEHQEEHQDVSVSYRWDCHHPEELTRIKLGLFSAFPSLESVQVQVLHPAGAISETLNAGKTALTLK